MPEVQERMVGQTQTESNQHYNAKRELCEFLNRYGIHYRDIKVWRLA